MFLMFVLIMQYLLIVIITFLSLATPVLAKDEPSAFRSTTFPVPRFVSLSSDEVYVRTGPGPRYPVKWMFKKEGLPVEIILEYDNWRKIRDYDGEIGWVHQSLVSGKRSAIVSKDDLTPIFKKANLNSAIVAYLEPSLVVDVERCGLQWCQVNTQGHEGWIVKTVLWGVYEAEKFD